VGEAWAQSKSAFTNTLMPMPAKISAHAGELTLTPDFRLSASGFRNRRLESGLQRLRTRLEYATGLTLSRELTAIDKAVSLEVRVQSAGQEPQSVNEDESYALKVTAVGATIDAPTVVGALRGMETFLQLIQGGSNGYYIPAVKIEDSPRFPWRGLLIDCARHFQPIEVLQRTLDGMAAVKMNVFHWRLTDDQGFRMESKIFPKLTGLGSDGLYYTQAQAREIVAYARDHGIRVVPDFDMPGHARSWFVGYPELASGPGPYVLRRKFGIDDAAMDPTRETTFAFLDKFLGEMAGIFPDPYLHISGDESNGAQWRANPKIVAYMRQHHLKDTQALQAEFNQRIEALLTKHGKHMMGWDEVLHPALPKDVVIESWRDTRFLVDAAKRGYRNILAAPYYLDHMKTAEEYYLADPLPPGLDLTSEQRKLVLGGEACMWTEFVDSETLDSRVWPRAAAIAERFWSPLEVRAVDDMYRRLSSASLRLEGLGLTHLTYPEAALRQMAGTEDIDAVRTFVSVLEPYGMSADNKTIQLTPLDRFNNVLPPDPPDRYKFYVLVQSFLQHPSADSKGGIELNILFQRWRDASEKVQALMETSPLLAEGRIRSQQLRELATIGSETVDHLTKMSVVPAGWKESTLAKLKAYEKPTDMLVFTVIVPLKDLVSAVQ